MQDTPLPLGLSPISGPASHGQQPPWPAVLALNPAAPRQSLRQSRARLVAHALLLHGLTCLKRTYCPITPTKPLPGVQGHLVGVT